MIRHKRFFVLGLAMGLYFSASAQDPSLLLQKLREKLQLVNSYVAEGQMKTNVGFLKVPQANVKVYYRKPDKLKIKNEQGISLVPRSMMGISLNGLLQGSFTALDGGTVMDGGRKLRVIKLLPVDENSELVLSTVYIDEANLLIIKSRTNTRDNGTYEVEMTYGQYARLALPDKVVCRFNTKDYKLPKGITFDYDDGSKPKPANPSTDNKGTVEISYSHYDINAKIPDAVFAGE